MTGAVLLKTVSVSIQLFVRIQYLFGLAFVQSSSKTAARLGRCGCCLPFCIDLRAGLDTRDHRVVPAIIVFVSKQIIFVECFLSRRHVTVSPELISLAPLFIQLLLVTVDVVSVREFLLLISLHY